MHLRKLASTYSIIIGFSMIFMWIVLLITNQVPDLNTAPVEISYHLLAEFLTAILLIISGVSLFRKIQWGFQLILISLGMLLYTVIVSAGYYADLGNMIMVGMFTVFQIFTTLLIGIAVFRPDKFKD